MKQKIRFAQLYAAHAAFNRYAAIIVSKTTRGRDNPLRKEGAAIIFAKTRVQSGGGSLPYPQDAVIIVKKSFVPENQLATAGLKHLGTGSKRAQKCGEAQIHRDNHRSNYFKEINFFVESQNEYCTAFVEYVFSAWARRLSTNTNSNINSDYARSPLLCGQTSE